MEENKNTESRKANVSNIFTLWWIRNFNVISNQRAKELGLEWYRNVYGDEVNRKNCRSLWVDKKGRMYRVSDLEHVNKTQPSSPN